MDEDKRKKDIALFKYAMIAPVVHENVKVQVEYFRDVSKKEHDVLHIGKKRFKVATLKGWLKQYRRDGFEALMPKTRDDKGCPRKINGTVADIIQQTVKQYPLLSCSAIHRLLIAEGHIGIGEITEGTVRKYISDNLLKEKLPPMPRKKFEKEHVNELWIGDCMHGPYISCGKKKCKTYLIAAIDDHSRVVVGGRFFFHENSICLEIILKEAIRRFGVPEVFYCDNGSLFASSHLQLACARLGIALVHSRPYDSPSRGKIERFFRTVRQKFLPMLRLSDIEDIEQLNDLFDRWLQNEYHRHLHNGINEKPMDRFMEDINQIEIKRLSEQQLDMAFQITIHRKVKNDSTVSIGGVLYECPTEFIGKKIEIRYPSDKPQELTIYEQDKPLCGLKKLNQNIFKPMYIPLSTVNVIDFYRQLSVYLSGQSFWKKSELFESIQNSIKHSVTNNKKIPVIIFDEAHLLKNENFYELQIIANFNMDSSDPALFILIGQPHLRERLLIPVLQPFNQRISLKYHLPPLSKDDTEAYIQHHLSLAGLKEPLFNQNAMNATYQNSGGIPRIINSLCIKSMTVGAIEKKDILTEEEVFRATHEL